MEKKTTFKVTTAEGTILTRKSFRPYTHVVLARRDFDAERAHAIKNNREANASNYAYYMGGWRKHYTTEQIADEVCLSGRISEAVAAGSLEAYLALKLEQRLASIPTAAAGPEIALGWSSSFALASKAASTKLNQDWYTGIRVVEATR
jgi:hypothetical protein